MMARDRNRVLDTIEDHTTVVNFLEELCMYRNGRASAPVVHETHDAVLADYMSQVAEAVVASMSK